MRRRASRRIPELTVLDKERHDSVGRDFVRIELELAETFWNLGQQSHSPEKAQLHRYNARRAMDGAMKALSRVRMDEKEREAMLAKVESLKAWMESTEQGS